MAGFGAAKPPKTKAFNGKKTFEEQMRRYTEHRVEGYPPLNVVDMYVHRPDSSKFWFVGKVAARSGATDDYALAAVVQKRLVLEHAKLLQPLDLGRSKTLEMWCAPANTEVSVAQKQQALRSLQGLKVPDAGVGALTLADVGFLPEQYDKENKGFYVKLPNDGIPVEESKVKIVSPQEAEATGLI